MLHSSSLHGSEGRPQCSMTIDERLKRALQGWLIGSRLNLERRSDVVSHAFRRKLLKEPEGLLSVRERERLLDRVSTTCGSGWYNRRLDQLEAARRNLREALPADDFSHRHAHAELRLDAVC